MIKATQSTPVVESWMHPEIRELRMHSSEYLAEVTDRPGMDHQAVLGATALQGGIMSACYFVGSPDSPTIVKFSASASPAEGEVLSIWGASGVKVPRVFASGIVTSTLETVPVSYTVMEAVQERNGQLASTLDSTPTDDLETYKFAGRLMGIELAKIHSLPMSSDFFGSKSTVAEFNNFTADWGGYLLHEVAAHAQLFGSLGYSSAQVDKITENIGSLPYLANNPSYVHNDPQPRNILFLPDAENPDIRVIDPNTIIGDKHWDFAHIANKLESLKLDRQLLPKNKVSNSRYEAYRHFGEAVAAEYISYAGGTIDQGLLRGCQLPRSLKRLEWFQRMSPNDVDTLRVARLMVCNQADDILHLKFSI